MRAFASYRGLLVATRHGRRRRDQGPDHHRDEDGDRRARAAVRARQRTQGDGELRSVRRARPRLRGGESADMILIASTELDRLISRARSKDRTDISRTGIGLAVRKGAPHPDVSTPDALKHALLAAKSIGQTSIDGRRHHRAARQARASQLGIRRAGLAASSSSRRAGPTAASACWWRAARPRSGCSRSPN